MNNLIGEEKRIGIVANEVLYRSVSVFFNHGIFVMMKKSNLDKTFMEDLESLNFKEYERIVYVKLVGNRDT